MTTSVDTIAALLVDAHRQRRPLEAMPPGVGALTREQAYRVQDRVARSLGGVGGWKVGASGPDAEPLAAPLASSLIAASPASLPAGRFNALGIEAEFAFRFARPLPPRERPWSRDEVIGAIGALVPTIEVVDSRLGAWARDEPEWKLADNQSNGFLVHGLEVREWSGIDLPGFPVELWIDGACAVSGEDSGNPARDLPRLAEWLANHLARTRSGLAAGAIVTTGSYTGLLPARAGQTVVARYPGLGEVSVRFTEGAGD